MIPKTKVLVLLPILAVSAIAFAQQEGTPESVGPAAQVVPESDQGPGADPREDDEALSNAIVAL
jgi:hypothetical protein